MLEALGGLALLVRGLVILSQALAVLVGGPARKVLTWATAAPLRAWLAGVLVGAISLNSSALGLSAISLATAGIAGFAPALVLGLAAKAGATVALILAATPLGALALPAIGLGFVLTLHRRSQALGEAILGLGMLLLGIGLMVQGLLPLTKSEFFNLVSRSLEASPAGLWLLGFALATGLGSANAVAALALALAGSGVFNLEAALALALGGGAGSGMVLVLTNWKNTPLARRIALAHLGSKVLLSLPFLAWVRAYAAMSAQVADVLGLSLPSGPSGALAVGHLLYHLLASVLVLPFLAPLERLMRRVVPDVGQEISPKYLSPEALDSRELASSLALREVGRIGDQLTQMLSETVRILAQGSGDTADVARREEKVDQLARAIVLYLSDLSARHPGYSPLVLIMAASEIEHMGDQVRRMLRKQDKLYAQNLEFSEEGRTELAEAAERVLERLRLSLAALATRSELLAEQVISERARMERYLLELRRSHLSRLERGRVESRATTLAHLDLLIVLDELDQSITRLAALSQDLRQPAAEGRLSPQSPN
ncbi:Na/Pi cotransporter family protein [Calidithermus timidus]|jgi:phosphate:Na+ symporter|uniref:Na/Pi cotransporter family protein n=1 Tax=Calidithermus timidus TaxID=307124 RepID=UPI0003785FA1|nr:Na/Pi symporter [Calidithermus timidus]